MRRRDSLRILLILALCALPSIFVEAFIAQQVAYIPVGQTRIVTQAQTIILSGGIIAELDVSKGKAAYDECMAKVDSTLTCEPIRQSAMRADAEQRLFDAVQEMYSRAVAPNDTTLRTKKIFLLQKPSVTP